MATVAGSPGLTYDVTVRFRGVIEEKAYGGGCKNGFFDQGPATTNDENNIYELAISSPPQTLFINNGTSGLQNCFGIDYDETFRADAGATVTLTANSVDDLEVANIDGSGNPITIPGVTAVTQPYDGQFVEMDVVSVVADPVASTATVGSGSAGTALAFAGNQWVTVPDAPSIEASPVTLEAWFEFAGVVDSFQIILAKPVGTGAEDSYAVWFQSADLNGGTELDSTSGAVAAPWTVVDGAWHHVAMTWDGSNSNLYVDGQLVECVANAGPTYDGNPLLLGADLNNSAVGGGWDGDLDELRVFDAVRTPDQVWADMHTHELGPTSSLVAEWTFNEGAGQIAHDDSGSGNDGALGSNSGVDAADPTYVPSTVP
jgi:hypothetical protein